MKLDKHSGLRKGKRATRIFLIAVAIGLSLLMGTAAAAYVAARVIVPIYVNSLAVGLTGLAGISALGADTLLNDLKSGDSNTRKLVLTELKDALESQLPQSLDPNLADWLAPALEQCKTDDDPDVVGLADEIVLIMASNQEAQKALN